MAGMHPVVVLAGRQERSVRYCDGARSRGARVVLPGAASERLGALVRSLGDERRVVSVPVDLSSLPSVRLAAKEISANLRHVDALLNIAATFSAITAKPRRVSR